MKEENFQVNESTDDFEKLGETDIKIEIVEGAAKKSILENSNIENMFVSNLEAKPLIKKEKFEVNESKYVYEKLKETDIKSKIDECNKESILEN